MSKREVSLDRARLYDYAIQLREQGKTRALIKKKVAEMSDPRTAARIVQEIHDFANSPTMILGRIAGMFGVGLGVLLAYGNTSGLYPTFPYAGWLVMVAGAAIVLTSGGWVFAPSDTGRYRR